MVHFCLEKLPLCIKMNKLLFIMFCVFNCIRMEKMIGLKGQITNLGVVFGHVWYTWSIMYIVSNKRMAKYLRDW
jgi:threonine/homoserine/homoserine lactone efflux protein